LLSEGCGVAGPARSKAEMHGNSSMKDVFMMIGVS